MICSNAELHLATVWQPTVEGFAQTITHLSFAVHAFVLYCDGIAFDSYPRVSLACAACKQSKGSFQQGIVIERCEAPAAGKYHQEGMYLRLRWLGHLAEMQSMHMCRAMRTRDLSILKHFVLHNLGSDSTDGVAAFYY